MTTCLRSRLPFAMDRMVRRLLERCAGRRGSEPSDQLRKWEVQASSGTEGNFDGWFPLIRLRL